MILTSSKKVVCESAGNFIQYIFIGIGKILQWFCCNKYKQIRMRKSFIVRDRSLSSLPSKQLSYNDLIHQKSAAIQSYRSKAAQESKLLLQKDEDIHKLKLNLDQAMKLAMNGALQSSRAKEDTMRTTQTKMHIEKKYTQIVDQYHAEKDARMKAENKILQLEYELSKQQDAKRTYMDRLETNKQEKQALIQQLKEVKVLEKKITEIQPLKNRIKVLESSNRNQKLLAERVQKEKAILQKTIIELEAKVKQSKPFQEEFQQRIAYLERVNLELERKMEDFNKKEHEYKKQINHYKTALAKMTTDRNKYRSILEEKLKILDEKIEYIGELEINVEQKEKTIKELQDKLQEKIKKCLELQEKLQSTIDFFKGVAHENEVLKERNAALQQYQKQVRRTLQSQAKVSEETNSYIIQRNSQVQKLEEVNKKLSMMLESVQKKFAKFDKLFQQNSLRGENEIKQSFYATLRANDKFQIELTVLKKDFNEKLLKYGEERDVLERKIKEYQPPIPTQKQLYQALIADKTEEILMLESSNDQLIKIKKEQQERILHLQKLAEQAKKEAYALKLKAAELFKIKKQLEEAHKKIGRYQEMIQEQKQSISDLNSQADALRVKSGLLSQKNFNLDLQNKNLCFKITELENIMKELDIEYLKSKKKQNEKNAHVIMDSIEKINNGINALSFFFSCCFCDESLTNPITLVPCGHNFCPKCKDAYAEYCYQCDTGQNIQTTFGNKFLKDAAAKYKFLLMVAKEAKTNLIKINL